MRIFVVDESEIIRMGVRALIVAERDWEICGEASNGAEALMKVQDLLPDVVILPLTMPLKNGFQTAKELRRIAPSTKIVVFSMHNVPATAREGGADAFVLKTAPAAELSRAIERITDSSPNSRANRAPA